ncbi:helix-turn-helix domain-containing protein [uncultured Roseibium sp.]
MKKGGRLKIVAAEFGLSERRTREWLRRYRTLGAAGLDEQMQPASVS